MVKIKNIGRNRIEIRRTSKKICSSYLGFTTAELLVVIFIIAILAALVLAGFRSYQKQNELKAASEQLANDIRRAQSMTQAGLENEILGRFPEAGYGIELDSSFPVSTYSLNAYSDIDSPSNVETLALPQNVEITSAQLDGVSNISDILFTVPGAYNVNFYDESVSISGQCLVITLTHTKTGRSIYVWVTSSGTIKVSTTEACITS